MAWAVKYELELILAIQNSDSYLSVERDNT